MKSEPAFPRTWSIARHLTILYAASSALLLLIAAAYLHWSLFTNLDREDDAFLADKIRVIRKLLLEKSGNSQLLRDEIQSGPATLPLTVLVRIEMQNGEMVLETPGMSNVLRRAMFPPPVAADELPRASAEFSHGGRKFRLVSAWAQGSSTNAQFLIHAALDVSSDEALLASFRNKLLLLFIAGIAFSVIAGVVITKRGLRPLVEITRATEQVSATQLYERIVPRGWPRELVALAKAFDQMLDRLEESFNRLSQISADLAHELRTPINNVRGEAGVALMQSRTPEEYRRILESSLEEFARLARLIDNLLFLARSDRAVTSIERQPFDARAAVQSVCDFYEAVAQDRGVRVTCEGHAVVEGHAVLFRQAVSNLLSNALNHTPRHREVSIELHERDRHVEIAVKDTGCGIAAEHLPKIFDRFYRVDAARSNHPNGSGLGLAIVKSIAQLHGGDVLVQSEAGRGSTFTLYFPKATAG